MMNMQTIIFEAEKADILIAENLLFHTAHSSYDKNHECSVQIMKC